MRLSGWGPPSYILPHPVTKAVLPVRFRLGGGKQMGRMYLQQYCVSQCEADMMVTGAHLLKVTGVSSCSSAMSLS